MHTSPEKSLDDGQALDALLRSLQPLESVRFWIEAYSNPDNGPNFQGHGMLVQMLKEYELLRLMLVGDQPLHTDDLAVAKFAQVLRAKMAKSRAKGRGGWDDPAQCRDETLARMLIEHTFKGNAGSFEDVATFAMMLHYRGADPQVLAKAAQESQAAAIPEGLAHALSEFVSAASSVNHGPAYAVKGLADDEPCYWQRKEWVDWLIGCGEEGRKALSMIPASSQASAHE